MTLDTSPHASGRPLRRLPKKQSSQILSSRLWLAHALWLSGTTVSEFSARYIDKGAERSRLAEKWHRGEVAVSPRTVSRVDGMLPGSRAIYDLPLHAMLSDRPPSKRHIKSITSLFFCPIPDEPVLRGLRIPGETWIVLPWEGIAQAIMSRSDLWGVTVALAQVIESEVAGDVPAHKVRCALLCKSLRTALALPWLTDDLRRDLKRHIVTICGRPYADMLAHVEIDWNTLDVSFGRAPVLGA